MRVDLALVGMGGAGLTLLHTLARQPRREPWRVAVFDDVDRLAGPRHDRTWCFWADGPNPADPAVTSSVDEVVIRTGTRAVTSRLAPYSYRTLRSGDYHRLVARELAASGMDVTWLPAADVVQDGPGRAAVLAGGRTVHADWVFDSRPRHPAPARSWLLQHFLGAFVRVSGPDAGRAGTRADLMDFRVAQPPDGFAFGYLVPAGVDAGRPLLLAEYTAVSRSLLPPGDYRRHLAGYLDLTVGRGRWEVVEVESGVVPMADTPPSGDGERVFVTGTSGGATRPSTGYTFTAMQRQAARVVAALQAGARPAPGPAYPARHRWLDSVMLRAVDTGRLDAPEFFASLFARNPGARVLDVLGGRSRLPQEAAFVVTAPWGPMITSAVLRGRRRPWPGPAGHIPTDPPQTD